MKSGANQGKPAGLEKAAPSAGSRGVRLIPGPLKTPLSTNPKKITDGQNNDEPSYEKGL